MQANENPKDHSQQRVQHAIFPRNNLIKEREEFEHAGDNGTAARDVEHQCRGLELGLGGHQPVFVFDDNNLKKKNKKNKNSRPYTLWIK